MGSWDAKGKKGITINRARDRPENIKQTKPRGFFILQKKEAGK